MDAERLVERLARELVEAVRETDKPAYRRPVETVARELELALIALDTKRVHSPASR